jgi:carnitine O-acetyltransferase
MLLQALKARHVQFETTAETRASERAAQAQARRRDIGKKLRLIDY